MILQTRGFTKFTYWIFLLKVQFLLFFFGSDDCYVILGGGFKDFLFSPLFGEDEPNLTNIFQRG